MQFHNQLLCYGQIILLAKIFFHNYKLEITRYIVFFKAFVAAFYIHFAVLHQVFQILAVGGGGVGDIVVRQPALQLGLVPLVVCCAFSCKSVWIRKAIYCGDGMREGGNWGMLV